MLNRTRWIVGLVIGASAATANAAHELSTDNVSVEILVERILSEDDAIAAEAATALDRRFHLDFEFDWWSDEQSTKARNRFIEDMQPFIPQIIAALSSDHMRIRQTAIDLLANLGPHSEEVVRAVWESRPARGFFDVEFEDDDLSEFWYLHNDLLFLKALVPNELPVMSLIVPRVRELCEKQESFQIEDIVSDDGPTAPMSMDVETLGTSVSLYYVAMLSAGWGPVEVPGLVELTAPEFPRTIRLWAIMVLTNMGPDAISAEPHLVKLLESEDALLRSTTTRALLSFRVENADVDTILSRARLSQDDEDDIRSDYLEYVGYLDDEREQMRNIEPESAGDSVEQIRRILKHTRGSLRLDACRMLIDLSKYAGPALPELRDAESSSEPLLSELATQAIKRISAEVGTARDN